MDRATRTGVDRHRTEEQTLDDPHTTAPMLSSPAAGPTGPSGARLGRAASDHELLLQIQSDDLGAFESFFDRYRRLIYRTAYGLTGDRQVAEEILQDTFLRAYRHRHSLRTDVSPVPWLHRVALNLCYSRLGRRRLPTEPIGDATHQVRDRALEPPDHVEREELRRTIRLGIASLPPKHQSVIVLYYLHGMSLQETAGSLGIALGTVKSRLHYALQGLQGHLAAERRGATEAPTEPLATQMAPASAIRLSTRRDPRR